MTSLVIVTQTNSLAKSLKMVVKTLVQVPVQVHQTHLLNRRIVRVRASKAAWKGQCHKVIIKEVNYYWRRCQMMTIQSLLQVKALKCSKNRRKLKESKSKRSLLVNLKNLQVKKLPPLFKRRRRSRNKSHRRKRLHPNYQKNRNQVSNLKRRRSQRQKR